MAKNKLDKIREPLTLSLKNILAEKDEPKIKECIERILDKMTIKNMDMRELFLESTYDVKKEGRNSYMEIIFVDDFFE